MEFEIISRSIKSVDDLCGVFQSYSLYSINMWELGCDLELAMPFKLQIKDFILNRERAGRGMRYRLDVTLYNFKGERSPQESFEKAKEIVNENRLTPVYDEKTCTWNLVHIDEEPKQFGAKYMLSKDDFGDEYELLRDGSFGALYRTLVKHVSNPAACEVQFEYSQYNKNGEPMYGFILPKMYPTHLVRPTRDGEVSVIFVSAIYQVKLPEARKDGTIIEFTPERLEELGKALDEIEAQTRENEKAREIPEDSLHRRFTI